MTDAPVEQDFYAEIKAKAYQATQLDIVPVAVGGAGYFPYVVENGNRMFNGNTYDYLNRRVVPGEAGAVTLADPFTGAYLGVIMSIAYTLSKADEAKLVDAQLKAQAQATAVVGTYEQTYGQITPAMEKDAGVETKIDYVIDYKVCKVWSGTGVGNPPLNLAQANLANLRALLPNLPSSAQALLNPITLYLQKIQAVLPLQNAGSYGTFILTALAANATLGTLENGGREIARSDGSTQVVPGWKVNRALGDILTGLDNTAQSLTIQMMVEKFDSTQVNATVSGRGGGTIPIGFVSIGVSGSFDLNLYSFQGTASSCRIEMTFPGLTVVPVEPGRWFQAGATGWYYPTPIYDAVRNGVEDVTGYTFNPEPAYDFTDGGDFGVLKTLLVSRFPTIVVDYTDGSWDEFSTQFKQESQWDVRLFGMKVGSFSQSLYVATAHKNNVGGGFSLVMTPSVQTLSVPPLDMTTYVVGAEVVYPGAEPSAE